MAQTESKFAVISRFPVGIFCSVALFCSWRSSHLLGNNMQGNLLWGVSGGNYTESSKWMARSFVNYPCKLESVFVTLPNVQRAISKNCHHPGLTLYMYRYFGMRTKWQMP